MTEIIIRRNPALEVLRGRRRQVHKVWLQKGLDRKLAVPIMSAAKERGVRVETADKQKLANLAKDSKHQGVVLEVGAYEYSDIDEMLALAANRGEAPFLLILDLLHGPQNIGALLRTAEIVGVHGVILQDRRAPDITPAVVQYAVGATEHLLIAQVTNLVHSIKQLQERDVWVAGMDIVPESQVLGSVDLDRALAIVVGHEGQGLRRLVGQSCDFLIKLPMRGQVESLNAAVAGSVLLYVAWQARGFDRPGQSNERKSD